MFNGRLSAESVKENQGNFLQHKMVSYAGFETIKQEMQQLELKKQEMVLRQQRIENELNLNKEQYKNSL